jgi:hypothetical protein
MNTTITTGAVVEQIARGDHDEQLTVIFEAIRARRKYLSSQRSLANQATLTPGMKVVITGRISPKYLIGLSAVVAPDPAARPGSLMIDIDEGQYTGRYGKHVGVPADCLTAAS